MVIPCSFVYTKNSVVFSDCMNSQSTSVNIFLTTISTDSIFLATSYQSKLFPTAGEKN